MRKAFTQLHIAVLLAGLTGVLGKLISLNEGLLVWWRLLLAVPLLWALALFRKPGRRRRQSGQGGPAGGTLRIDPRDVWRIIGIGGVAALHWVAFYGSIKYSNVSVALLCFSAIGFFTAIIEPLVLGHRIDVVELLLGLMVIAGIFFIFQVDPHFKTGICIGLVSALLGSLFPVLNKRILQRVSPENVTLYELTGGFLVLSVLLPFYLYLFPAPSLIPGWADLGWLLILSWLCTVLAFNLSMSALRRISAFTVNLSYNLEPVYGILLAFLLFREDKYLNVGFYIGFFLILLSIILQMVRLRRKQPKLS
jgi:drug/metabolite transporter (DMT)-like permease